jgi:hypothetical protein
VETGPDTDTNQSSFRVVGRSGYATETYGSNPTSVTLSLAARPRRRYDPSHNPFERFIGAFSLPERDVAENHDKYIAEAYAAEYDSEQ